LRRARSEVSYSRSLAKHSRGVRPHIALDRRRDLILSLLQIVVSLKVHPEVRRRVEEPREPQSRIGGDPTLGVHDLDDPVRGHSQLARELVRRDPERLEEVLDQNLAGMNWRTDLLALPGHDVFLSVVIDHFDALGVSVLPHEADAKLLVHSDAVLAGPISLERFELVSRGYTKIAKLRRGMERQEPAERHVIKMRELPASFAHEHLLGFLAAETLYHTLRVLRTAYWVKHGALFVLPGLLALLRAK